MINVETEFESRLLMRGAAPLSRTMSIAWSRIDGSARRRFAVIGILSIVSGVLPGAQVYAVGALVSSVVDSADYRGYLVWAIVFGVVVFVKYVLENIIKFLGDVLTLRLSYDIEIDAVQRLGDMEVQNFESSKTYDIIQRVDESTGEHVYGLFDMLRSAIQALLSLLSICAVLWQWSPVIASMLLVAPIPGCVATFRVQTRAYDIEYKRATKARLAGYLRGLLMSDSAKKETRLFRLDELFTNSYSSIKKNFLRQDIGLARFALLQAGGLGAASVLASFGAVVYAAIIAGVHNRVGELAGFISATTQVGPLVLAAFIGFTGIYQHLLYVSNWVALVDTQPARIAEGAFRGPSDGRGGSVEFRNVSFRYPGTDVLALNDVSFSIDSGSITAFVGINGCGKSTICKLLLRFYEPDEGEIFVDGRPIGELSREYLYSWSSALFQDFVKYERSLRDNIEYGYPRDRGTADDERLWDSLEAVGLRDWAMSLPERLNTMLGRHFEGGHQPSIGQWQRIAAARALVKKPRLLVLDEPTASVDAVSEKILFEAMAALGGETTVVLVSHRFATVAHADRIIVIDDGAVVGVGGHADLMEDCAHYRDMYDAQGLQAR
ncbi:ABC transporter ATP-binding protein [Actinomyces sp. zg296]|uniref:ABC transporter ATP-binding protein n=1 Tax=Actinomyces sp. zg296 TaxID=2609289 RepID=UPI002E2AD0F6|nr:ABC transporter ATP-binding protein [Actinomyces sp. zg296]